MKRLFLITLAFITVLSGNAQEKLKGNGNVTVENREATHFNSLNIRDDIEIILSQGQDPMIKVETDENLHKVIFTEVQGSTLDIHLSNPIKKSKALKVYVTIPNDSILKIEVFNKAEIKSMSEINCKSFDASLQGKSKVEISVNAEKANLNIIEKANATITLKNNKKVEILSKDNSNSKLNLSTDDIKVSLLDDAKLNIEGIGLNMNLSTTGKSDFKGEKFIISKTELHASGKTDISINTTDELNINIKDQTEVSIFGNPKYVLNLFENEARLYKKEISK